MGYRIGGAKSKETRYSMLKLGFVGSYAYILQNICIFRTLSCRILPNLTLTYRTLFPCFLGGGGVARRHTKTGKGGGGGGGLPEGA